MGYIVIALMLIAAAGYAYARFIEPRRLAVRRFTVESGLVLGKIKIAAFSDTHIGMGGMDSGRLAKVMEAIQNEAPDMVVFLGDLYYNYSNYGDKDIRRLTEVLTLPGLANAAKYAVRGNHDMAGRTGEAFRGLFEAAGWEILVNASSCRMGINIIGSDDVIFGEPEFNALIREGEFNLLLVHEPDIADAADGVQLQLSGHTHGGQIRLPFVGAAVLPVMGRKYVRGAHQKPDGGTVIVSGGLGMSTLPLRFCAVPEITVITVEGGAND